MPHVIELGLLARPLAEQPGMSFLRFSPWKSRLVLRDLPPRPLPEGGPPPSFGTKLLRQVQYGDKKLGGDIAVEQPIPVLAEHRRIPHRIVHRQTDEPAEQQIIVELLHQLPFRADRVERLQRQRPQQPLRWNRRPAVAGVKLAQIAREIPQRRVDQVADGRSG
jgi:hypothetical protein